MDNVDVIEKVVTEEPELPVHIPYANYNSPGIASFNSTDFHVEPDGEVQLSKEIKAIRDDAEDAAAAAASSAEEASGYANQAETHAQNAQSSAGNAANSAVAASGFAAQASAYASQAEQSAQDAADSATETEGYKDTATQQAQAAASSASAAAQSASNAVVSANTATDAKSAAQTAATNAEQSATDAETFAGNAETSASQAADSALFAQQYRDQAKEYAQKEYQIYDSFDALPRPGNSAFIYLVPVSESQTNDKYNEYLWIDNINDYEYLGAVNDIDLSNYAQQNGTYPNMSVGKATADANGNNIVNTYATKVENNAKYTKPSSGIPESDLAQAVKDKLNQDVGIQNYEVIVRQTLPAANANSPDFVQTADGVLYRKKETGEAYTVNTGDTFVFKDDYELVEEFVVAECKFSNGGRNYIKLVVSSDSGYPVVEYWTENGRNTVYSADRWAADSYRTITFTEKFTFTAAQWASLQVNGTFNLANPQAFVYEEIGDASSIAAKYTKPSGGIPKTDLASAVQTSLNKADTALQSVPLATSSAVGGVKPVAKTDDMTQSVGVDSNGALFTAPGGGGTIEYMTDDEVDALFASTPSIPSFADATWEQIAQVAEAGTASDYFAVGDEKTITLSTDEQITLVILGFNHDDLSDGSGKAGITIGMKNLLATQYSINATATNAGGWDESEMRTSTMATLLSQLPSDLQSVVKQVNKKATAGSQSTSITTSADKLWLLAEVEVDGTTSAGYADEGERYEYWKTVKDGTVAADRIKYSSNGSGSAGLWWLRSPRVSTSMFFLGITSAGGVFDYSANVTRGVCFCFCV